MVFQWEDGYQPNFVSDRVSPNAKILCVGEAPGGSEDSYIFDPKTYKLLSILDTKGEVQFNPPYKEAIHLPFVGRSGVKLDEWLAFAGLTRDDIYFTNVFPYRPQNNNFDTIPEDLLNKWVNILHQKIALLKNINVIAPMGNSALLALVGKINISDWRGSILEYKTLDGRAIKVIPTLHPAGFFHNPAIAYFCMLDWMRIANDRKFPELNVPTNHAIIHPDKKQIALFYAKVKANPTKRLCIDIENDPSTHLVDCIGFGLEDNEAICIPLEDDTYWPSGADRDWALAIVKALCESPNLKILQNGFQHDGFYLRMRFGIQLVNYKLDTMAMSHCLTPTAPTKLKPHALDKIMSIHLRAAYHKKDTKEDDAPKAMWKVKDKNKRWKYCCDDVCWQYRACDVLEQKLKDAGRWELYQQVYGGLLDAIIDMSCEGVLIDQPARRKLLATSMIKCQEITKRVEEKVGIPLHAEKGFSVKKLTKFFYEDIGFKKLSTSPTDELALKKLQQSYTDKITKIEETGKLPKKVTQEQVDKWKFGLDITHEVLAHREAYQLGTFAFPKNIDEDSRLRCKFKFGTMFCRLSSTSNPFGTGRNLQNLPYASKGMIIPDDPDWVLLELDLSQVENRIVFALTGDSELIKLAKILPWDFDIHTYNAAFLFGIPESEVTKEQRQTGKRIIHAGNYGEGPQRLSEVLLKEAGLVWPIKQCEDKIKTYFTKMPAIPKWQHRTIDEVRRYRFLENSWKQRFDFWWDELNKRLDNRALACRPQSDNGMLINVQGVIPAYKLCKEKYAGKARLMLQVHDSLLIGVHRKVAYDLNARVGEAMSKPHDFYGTILSIPTQSKVGLNYHDMHEFKEPPTQKEFEEAMENLK